MSLSKLESFAKSNKLKRIERLTKLTELAKSVHKDHRAYISARAICMDVHRKAIKTTDCKAHLAGWSKLWRKELGGCMKLHHLRVYDPLADGILNDLEKICSQYLREYSRATFTGIKAKKGFPNSSYAKIRKGDVIWQFCPAYKFLQTVWPCNLNPTIDDLKQLEHRVSTDALNKRFCGELAANNTSLFGTCSGRGAHSGFWVAGHDNKIFGPVNSNPISAKKSAHECCVNLGLGYATVGRNKLEKTWVLIRIPYGALGRRRPMTPTFLQGEGYIYWFASPAIRKDKGWGRAIHLRHLRPAVREGWIYNIPFSPDMRIYLLRLTRKVPQKLYLSHHQRAYSNWLDTLVP